MLLLIMILGCITFIAMPIYVFYVLFSNDLTEDSENVHKKIAASLAIISWFLYSSFVVYDILNKVYDVVAMQSILY